MFVPVKIGLFEELLSKKVGFVYKFKALFQSQNVVILYHPEPTVELIFTFLKHFINIL